MIDLGRYQEIIHDFETPEGKKSIGQIKNQSEGPIVFASGCYDILQPGHVIFFEQLRQLAGTVVVGVGRDSVVSELKQGRPIVNQANRAYMLAALKPVDHVILEDREIQNGKIDFAGTLKILKPDIFVLNSDDSGIKFKRVLCDTLGITLQLVDRVTTDFLTPTSTTDIIEKILSLPKN